jgi:hypothetical protein
MHGETIPTVEDLELHRAWRPCVAKRVRPGAHVGGSLAGALESGTGRTSDAAAVAWKRNMAASLAPTRRSGTRYVRRRKGLAQQQRRDAQGSSALCHTWVPGRPPPAAVARRSRAVPSSLSRCRQRHWRSPVYEQAAHELFLAGGILHANTCTFRS